MTKIAKRYSNQKIKRFLFFLLVAALFWVLTKFSREFTSPMRANVKYGNLPETTVLGKDNPEELRYDLTANGFEILFYKFKKPLITIPVDKFYVSQRDSFAVPNNELLQQLETYFNKYLEVRNLAPDPFVVKLDPVILKKVKIYAQTDLNFRRGYNGVDDFIVSPDSVVIIGPRDVVKGIDSVKTKVLSLKDVHKNISEQVAVDIPHEGIVSVDPQEVKIKWQVSEFSQEQFILPIEVINLPPGMDLKLVPEFVTVTFNIAVDDFAHIQPKNFKLICDFSKRNESQSFMLPELIKQPTTAVNISINPKKIDYFIFKK